jgi:hypothetical protein
MNFVESRLLGVHIDETGREVVLSLIDTSGTKFALQLHGVERLLINEMRQQNVIEDVTHWTRGESTAGLQEAAFALMAGAPEKDCGPQLAAVARGAVDKVARGELEMLEISAVFGAQMLASFASMSVQPEG